MPRSVKDLATLYEPSFEPTLATPSPTPARFLRHSARRESAPLTGSRTENLTKNPFEDDIFDQTPSLKTPLPASAAATGTFTGRDDERAVGSTSHRGARTLANSASPNKAYSLNLQGPSSNRATPVSEVHSPELLASIRKSSMVSTSTTFPSPSKIRSSTPSKSRNNLSKSAYSPLLPKPNDPHDIHDNDNDTASSVTAWTLPLFPLAKGDPSYIPLNNLSKDSLSGSKKDRTRSTDTLSLPTMHKPIPAKDVFSRHALPLYLPHLDDLLSSIPAPQFEERLLVHSPTSKKDKGKSHKQDGVFPPLHKLEGKTLDELHHNSPVPSFLKDRNSILSSIVTSVIGVAGSSAIANYYSLQGLYDGVQIFALVLSSVVPKSSLEGENKWRTLFLSTIPNILALNIPTKITQSLIFLSILMVICGILLYRFHIGTSLYSPSAVREGLQARQPRSSWGIIAISFALTVLYLPLSTIAMHGILWSSDFWVVPNPYTNKTFLETGEVPVLGPENEWRDPLDFCFTTTMRRDEVNYAPVIVSMCAVTFIFMTLWFPIRLMQTIRASLPRVDPYTELGQKRTRPEMELEYQRLLERDRNPFAFLYKDFRRSWGTYKSIYLWAKLSALLIVAILSPDNCVFRSFPRNTIDTIRQSVLTGSMLIWFILQCILVPFVDPVSNASEWISRLNYLLTSATGLWASLHVMASPVLNGPVLYVIYAGTYGLDFYFAIIGTSIMRRWIKRITRRIDFSIDIFSPKLDLSANSPHLRRRIWQESIGTLILTDERCQIPPNHKIRFSEPDNFEWPPYLLNFQGTPGERHVENLKILREEGLKKYARAIAMISGPESKLFNFLRERIQKSHVGPDSYWRPIDSPKEETCYKSFFGNAWWVPFPPSLVIRYDVGGYAVLRTIHEFEHYLSQNEDPQIRRRGQIRTALRALDRQIVVWPYTHVQLIGTRTWLTGPKYSMQSVTHFHSCVFTIKHHGIQYWKDLPFGSGFDIEMVYTEDIKITGDAIGLNEGIEMTPDLAKFLRLNRHLIQLRLGEIEERMEEYREFCRQEAELKQQTLSYEFLTLVYNWPLQRFEIIKAVEQNERDLRVRDMFASSSDALDMTSQRMQVTSRSEITVWWYLFWDDFWRRNHDTIASLQQHEADFNPHYAASIAYRPLPRAAMEAFLLQRGMLSTRLRRKRVIHHGFLNKFYFRLNQIAFHNTDKAVLVHVGETADEVDLNDVDLTTHVRSSSIGTGAGTQVDDPEIRVRPAFKWEDVFNDPIHGGGKTFWRYLDWRRWKNIIAVWFGITPLDHRKLRTNGIALDVMLDDSGRYVVIERTRPRPVPP